MLSTSVLDDRSAKTVLQLTRQLNNWNLTCVIGAVDLMSVSARTSAKRLTINETYDYVVLNNVEVT